jgi:CheY-like chemotaxis protein
MKILIVDDEPLVRKSLSRAFRAKGHEVVEAADGTEGFSCWLGCKPDLVLLDVLMPGMSGPELLKAMSTKGNGFIGRVILMSAYSGEHNVTTAQQMGADLFIPKPFDDVFALVAKAEELLGGSDQS